MFAGFRAARHPVRHPILGCVPLPCHSRESGNPASFFSLRPKGEEEKKKRDPRFRGGDGLRASPELGVPQLPVDTNEGGWCSSGSSAMQGAWWPLPSQQTFSICAGNPLAQWPLCHSDSDLLPPRSRYPPTSPDPPSPPPPMAAPGSNTSQTQARRHSAPFLLRGAEGRPFSGRAALHSEALPATPPPPPAGLHPRPLIRRCRSTARRLAVALPEPLGPPRD